MSATSPSLLGRCLVGLLWTAAMFGGGYLLHSLSATAGRGPDSEATVAGEDVIVCSGFVDVEGGVTPLSPVQPGQVAEVLVDENEVVAAGAVLLRLDDELAGRRVEEAQGAVQAVQVQLLEAHKVGEQQAARVTQQQAGIAAAGYRLAAARALLARKQALLELQQLNPWEVTAAAEQVKELEAFVTAERARLAELELHDPTLAVRRVEAELAVMQARLKQAQRLWEDCQLRAPRAGKVLRILVGPGEAVGGAARQPALLFCREGPRLVRAEVEQEFAGRLRPGQSAVVTDDVDSGLRRHGHVLRVSDWYTQRRAVLHEPVLFHDVRTVECLIRLERDEPPLRIGQKVQVTLGRPAP